MIGDYRSQEAIDNDDGSAYYNTHHNLFYQGSAMKSDFGGHSNHHHDNVYAWIGSVMGLFFVSAGAYDDAFANNTVAIGNHANGAWLMPHYTCDSYNLRDNYTGEWPITFSNNSYWTQDGVVHSCCARESWPLCNESISWGAWQTGSGSNGNPPVRPPQDAGSAHRIWLQGDQEMNRHLLNTARGFLDMPHGEDQ